MPDVTDPRTCSVCGAPLIDAQCVACARRTEASVIKREIIVLVLLVAVVVAGYFLTRYTARANRDRRQQDAATLYDLGRQQLQAGNTSDAIPALRQALALDNGNRSLRFALAGALGEAGDHESARQVLLGIRETSPEDPVVNLELARLNAREDNASPEAARYYQSALYGTWTGSDADARRRAVRMELIQFLLSHQQRERALSELLALSTTVPDDPASHNEVGRLFLLAGEPRRGLDQFQRSLQLDAANEAARSGAGEAAFDAGDYAAAIRYLNDAASGSKSHDLRTVAELVIGRDPLRSGLSESAQYVRLSSAADRARERLEACQNDRPQLAAAVVRQLDALAPELKKFQDSLHGRDAAPLETVEAGVSVVYRVEQASQSCRDVSAEDRALLLIGKQHDTHRN